MAVRTLGSRLLTGVAAAASAGTERTRRLGFLSYTLEQGCLGVVGRLFHQPLLAAAAILTRFAIGAGGSLFTRSTLFARRALGTRSPILTRSAVITGNTIFAGSAILTRSAILAGAAIVASDPLLARRTLFPATIVARGAILAGTLFARRALFALRPLVGINIAFEIEIIVLLRATIRLLPGAIVVENAEIMVGELEVIFRVHSIALTLRITGEVLVLLEKLRRIAARAIVDAIAVIAAGASAAALRALSTTTATAADLPVVYQRVCVPFKTVRRSCRSRMLACRREARPRATLCHDHRTAVARMTLEWAFAPPDL